MTPQDAAQRPPDPHADPLAEALWRNGAEVIAAAYAQPSASDKEADE
jgi:hypothetical protein